MPNTMKLVKMVYIKIQYGRQFWTKIVHDMKPTILNIALILPSQMLLKFHVYS